MDASRRGFLGGAFSLAALAVVPGTALALGESDRQKLVRLLSTNDSVIEGYHFVLSDGQPVVFENVARIRVRNCTFRWIGRKPKYCIQVMGPCSDVFVSECVFETRDAVEHRTAAYGQDDGRSFVTIRAER